MFFVVVLLCYSLINYILGWVDVLNQILSGIGDYWRLAGTFMSGLDSVYFCAGIVELIISLFGTGTYTLFKTRRENILL